MEGEGYYFSVKLIASEARLLASEMEEADISAFLF